MNGWRGVESYFLFVDSAASTISAAYSGLQECGRFSARLPPGQQSSAAFLELGGNAMICHDTPQILQTSRCTHVGCMCCTQCSADLPRSDGSDPRQSGLGILEGPPTSQEPPSRQEGGTSQNGHLQSATLPLCHFATSKNLVQDVMFRHLGFVRKREKKASPNPEIPAGFCQFARKTVSESAVLSLSLLELSPY